MPFVRISYQDSLKILKDKEYLKNLLIKKIINPYEYEILNLVKQVNSGKEGSKEELKNACSKHFPDDQIKANELLTRFAESNEKQVAWVLFSRTFHLKYHEENPFEGYLPTNDEIVFNKSTEKLVLK